MLDQVPTCGRIVWHWPGPKPAIVVHGWKDDDGYNHASLVIFTDVMHEPPTKRAGNALQCDASAPREGCWSWMPYQEGKATRPEGNQSESAVVEPRRHEGTGYGPPTPATLVPPHDPPTPAS